MLVLKNTCRNKKGDTKNIKSTQHMYSVHSCTCMYLTFVEKKGNYFNWVKIYLNFKIVVLKTYI